MKIGELSRRTAISVRMLRYYEAEGLLSPQRTESGYRDYGDQEEAAVERIKALGLAGMTLPVIRQFLPCALAGRSEFESCDELRLILHQQMKQLEDRISGLNDSQAVLANLLSAFDASKAGVRGRT